MTDWTYELCDNTNTLIIEAGPGFTIDLLPSILKAILNAILLPRAERIRTIEIVRSRA